jgi:hypothetical protein
MNSFPEETRRDTDQKAQQKCRAEPSHYYGTTDTKSWKKWQLERVWTSFVDAEAGEAGL